MEKIKPKKYTKAKKLIRDWTDKKNYLCHCRLLKNFVQDGTVVEKFHELISSKQRKWLENYISFITQKRRKSKNEFEEDFYKLLKNAFYR